MRATNPRCSTSRLTSATLKRDSGTPSVEGSSHASALTSTVSAGGKGPGASWARQLFEPRQSVSEEALAPSADHLAARVEPGRDLVIAQPFGRQQDHLGPDDLEI